MTFAEFAHAVAIVESGDDPYAWGDNGLAMGRYQQHPSFTFQWMPLSYLRVRSSWDEVERAALETFWDHFSQRSETPLKIIMRYHLGPKAVDDGQWDAAYARHFNVVAGLTGACV